MIKVEFFGLYRMEYKTAEWETSANTLLELLQKIADSFKINTVKELKNAVIFVNGVSFLSLSKYRTKLKDGDNVLIMSPASGG